MIKILEKIFTEINHRIEAENKERREDGRQTINKAEVTLLGQISLLVNQKVAAILALAQTADVDALLRMDTFVKDLFKKLIKQQGFVYDEDSEKIWIPKDAKFEDLFDYPYIQVKVIDAESALLSKAIKAPAKNKQLIQDAIASEKFKNLIKRIEENKGKITDFQD